MAGPGLSKPETDPVYLWIQDHPWSVGLITVGVIVCIAATVVGMAFLLGSGALVSGTPSTAAS